MKQKQELILPLSYSPPKGLGDEIINTTIEKKQSTDNKYVRVNQSNASKIEYDFQVEQKKEASELKKGKGMFYMVISAICMTLMAFFLKVLYLNSTISTYEVTYWQSLVIAGFNLFMFKTLNKDHMLVREDMRSTLILRSIAGFLGVSGFYLALQYTDLSKATALYWTNPIMTSVIAFFWIDESLNFVDWLAGFISFAGVIIIEKPWGHEVAASRSYEDMMGSVAALVGAFFIAIAQMQTRKLGKKVHFLAPPFYQAIFSAFIAPLMMIIFLRYRTAHTTYYGLFEIFMIIIISLLMFTAQVFNTKALQVDKAGRVAPVNQLQIIFNWALDFIVISTRPNSNELVGGALIIGSTLIISILRSFDIIK